LNDRIKKLRKELDLTQQEFADKIGMKRNTVANYETNRNEPSNSVITLICKTFNVNETWLRTGEGDMFIESDNTVLSKLASEYKMDSFEKAMVSNFLKLRPEQREAIKQYVKSLLHEVEGEPAAPAHAPTIEEQARAEAEQHARRIYEQILAEKKAQAGLSSESSGPKAGGGTAKRA